RRDRQRRKPPVLRIGDQRASARTSLKVLVPMSRAGADTGSVGHRVDSPSPLRQGSLELRSVEELLGRELGRPFERNRVVVVARPYSLLAGVAPGGSGVLPLRRRRLRTELGEGDTGERDCDGRG